MKFISMFLASIRMAGELDRTRYVADPESTEAAVDAICGNNRPVDASKAANDKDTVAAGSLPNPA